jgi:hypothetical protein
MYDGFTPLRQPLARAVQPIVDDKEPHGRRPPACSANKRKADQIWIDTLRGKYANRPSIR